MSSASQRVSNGYEDGRKDQYRQMMEVLAQLQGKYRGVRGELLAKVKAELEASDPSGGGSTLRVVNTPAPVATVSATASASAIPAAKPSPCRACGRDMKPSGTAGTLVCQNGHTRLT